MNLTKCTLTFEATHHAASKSTIRKWIRASFRQVRGLASLNTKSVPYTPHRDNQITALDRIRHIKKSDRALEMIAAFIYTVVIRFVGTPDSGSIVYRFAPTAPFPFNVSISHRSWVRNEAASSETLKRMAISCTVERFPLSEHFCESERGLIYSIFSQRATHHFENVECKRWLGRNW